MIDRNYDLMFTMEAPSSKNHPRMSTNDRASQFNPFKALTGYEKTLFEKARLTEEKIILDDDSRHNLDVKLNYLCSRLKEKPQVEFTYFKKDLTKSGGKYCKVLSSIRHIDESNQEIILDNKQKINFNDIYDIKSEILKNIN